MVIIFGNVLSECVHEAKNQCSGTASRCSCACSPPPQDEEGGLSAVIAAGPFWVLGSPGKISLISGLCCNVLSANTTLTS